MNFLKLAVDPMWWKTLLGSDFNRGFIAALAVILILMVFLLILRTIVTLIFRTRRASFIEVKRPDGSTIVNRDVIASVVDRELKDYPAIQAEKILLTRRGGSYQLTIYCSYLLCDQAGIPAFCDEFKPRLLAALDKGFGIEDLSEIRLWVCAPEENGSDTDSCDTSADKDAYIGL